MQKIKGFFFLLVFACTLNCTKKLYCQEVTNSFFKYDKTHVNVIENLSLERGNNIDIHPSNDPEYLIHQSTPMNARHCIGPLNHRT